jgi:antitoxin (DNA-binding transcriptional repressor) of toxin-antitoxin stability system
VGALHITEAELARDIAAVLDRVQAGAEIVIERDSRPVAVLRAAEPRRRKLSEIAASLSQDSTAFLDADFAADVQAFFDRHREPLRRPEIGPGGAARAGVAI